MDHVLDRYLSHLTSYPKFKIIHLCASRHPLGSVLFYGNHGLHRLVTHTSRQSLADFTDEHLLHLWLTLEYIRLSEAKATQRTVDFYKLNDVWATILHSRTPALTTAVDITNYIKSSIIQYNPQFSYDDAVLTVIAEAVVTLFASPFKRVALQPVISSEPPPRTPSLSEILEDYSNTKTARPSYMQVDYPGYKDDYEPYDEQYWAVINAEEENRQAIEEHYTEFRELDYETRYNDTDSWQNPHGYRD